MGRGIVRVNYINSLGASTGYRYIFRSFDFTTRLTIHTAPGHDQVTGLGTPTSAFYSTIGH